MLCARWFLHKQIRETIHAVHELLQQLFAKLSQVCLGLHFLALGGFLTWSPWNCMGEGGIGKMVRDGKSNSSIKRTELRTKHPLILKPQKLGIYQIEYIIESSCKNYNPALEFIVCWSVATFSSCLAMTLDMATRASGTSKLMRSVKTWVGGTGLPHRTVWHIGSISTEWKVTPVLNILTLLSGFFSNQDLMACSRSSLEISMPPMPPHCKSFDSTIKLITIPQSPPPPTAVCMSWSPSTCAKGNPHSKDHLHPKRHQPNQFQSNWLSAEMF